MESDVEAALSALLETGETISARAVRELTTSTTIVDVPPLAPGVVDLDSYDSLLVEVGT
jgi:hypothetical protein